MSAAIARSVAMKGLPAPAMLTGFMQVMLGAAKSIKKLTARIVTNPEPVDAQGVTPVIVNCAHGMMIGIPLRVLVTATTRAIARTIIRAAAIARPSNS